MIRLSNRKSLRNQVTACLVDAILAGELRSGERLIETQLAKQMGVAQATLRESLQELEHRGLVVKYDNRGTFVTSLTLKEVDEIYAVRLELEPMAGALACQRLTQEHAVELARLLDEIEREGQAEDFTELMKSDLAFHQLIWKVSDNAALEKALNLICAPLFVFYLVRLSHFKHASPETLHDFVRDQSQHSDMLTALKTRNPQEVRRVFRQTLEAFRELHIKHVREVDEDQNSPRSGQGQSDHGTVSSCQPVDETLGA